MTRGADPGLRPGDAISVRIWREDDLSGEYPVDEEQVVVLPLLGERSVEGVEPKQLERKLQVEFAEFLDNPSIEVRALRRISVLGEVRSPDVYFIDATVTLTDALAEAGGVSGRARLEDVRLLRDGDLIRPAVREGVIVNAPPLLSGDRIVVRRRGWVDRNLPIFGLGIGGLGAAIAAIVVAGG